MDKCGVVDTLLISSQYSQERVKSLFVINESFVKFCPTFARLTLDGDNWSLAFHSDEMKVHFSVHEDRFPVCQDGPWKPVVRVLIVTKSREIVAGREGLGTY